MSAGCRCVPEMSGRSLCHTTLTPAAVERQLREARERLLEEDAQLQPRERGAQAEVPASRSEGLVLGIAAHVVAVGVLVAGLVAIGGHVPHHDLLALFDLPPVKLGVA